MEFNFVSRDEFIPVQKTLEEIAKQFKVFMEEKDWKVYSNDEAAMLLGVSKRTLQNWRDKGLISYHQIGSKIYYSKEAIQQFLNENRREAFAKEAKGGARGN